MNPSLPHLNVVTTRAENAFVLVAAELRPFQVAAGEEAWRRRPITLPMGAAKRLPHCAAQRSWGYDVVLVRARSSASLEDGANQRPQCPYDREVCSTRNCRTHGQVTPVPRAVTGRAFTADS